MWFRSPPLHTLGQCSPRILHDIAFLFNLNDFPSTLGCEFCYPNKLEKFKLNCKGYYLIIKIRSEYGRASEQKEPSNPWGSQHCLSLGIRQVQKVFLALAGLARWLEHCRFDPVKGIYLGCRFDRETTNECVSVMLMFLSLSLPAFHSENYWNYWGKKYPQMRKKKKAPLPLTILQHSVNFLMSYT